MILKGVGLGCNLGNVELCFWLEGSGFDSPQLPCQVTCESIWAMDEGQGSEPAPEESVTGDRSPYFPRRESGLGGEQGHCGRFSQAAGRESSVP